MRSDRYKKKKSKKVSFFRCLGIFVLVVSLIALGLLYYIDILPLKYFIPSVALVLVVDVIDIALLFKKGFKRRFIGTLMAIILMFGYGYGIYYELGTIGFIKKIGAKDYKTQNYSVIVLNTSKYKKLIDVKDEYIGILNSKDTEGVSDAVAHLNKKVKVSYKEKDDLKELESNLLSGDLSVIMLEDAYYEIAKEENEEFASSTRVVYKFSIDIKTTDEIKKEVDITEKPFNIFIAGIDTYGKISSVSRSDVNMVVSVNPKTHKILLTSIPRDYYVYLHGITSYKDKITHAGIHGIETSVKTVEDLLDCDINYYFKVNFSSLIKIVNAIGGIEVESPYTFTTYDHKYTFNKGYNRLNGEKALYFVRERKAFKNGDRTRNQNGQIVLSAVINKVLSKTLITKYTDILDSVDGSFVTNLDYESMTKLIKKQIKDDDKWTIETYNLDGKDSSNYTYSYKSAKSYVMEPDMDTVNEAIKKIKEINEK